jgi:putative PIN family toxin of toxin-antitoxin system
LKPRKRVVFTIIATIPLLAELRGVIQREKFVRQLRARSVSIDDLLDGYIELVEMVPPADLSAAVAGDPDDDTVLAAALGGRADLIVSGDAHLLNMKHYQNIPIVPVVDAVKRVARDAPARS